MTEKREEIRRLVESQGFDSYEERQDYYKRTEDTDCYRQLDSVFRSVVMQLTKFKSTSAENVDARRLPDFDASLGLDSEAIHALVAKLMVHVFHGHSDEEQMEMARFFVAHDIPQAQAMMGHLLFLCGYFYHRRNTTLVDELIAERVEGTDDKSP